MNEDDDKTVFQASSGTTPPQPPEDEKPVPPADATIVSLPGSPAPEPSDAASPPSDATIIAVGTPSQPAAADPTIISPSSSVTPPPPPAPPAPRGGAGVQPGDVLNHIFEVKRFIARGGMGEVFEGINVNSEERVAIKVILPALAADPNVTAMFRKEAQTLVRLSHPALVQYRVLAQEPQLGIFYIVTEFIEGVNLSDVLGKTQPTPQELIGLTRRLAEGLKAAHELGAIHRDIAPDNVLLEGETLARARIVDFGIAKDIDPGSKTIIGDGFAGKLGYVAPEQLGDFGRDVGPWTDVYSLALVILAVARGRGTDMGGSFVDAIDKRRKGVDTSAAPPEIRPVLDRMLTADPAQRLRSMDEVLAALREAEAPPAKGKAARKPKSPPMTGAAAAPSRPALADVPKPALIGGAAVAGLALIGTIGWIAFGGTGKAPIPPAATAAAPGASAVSIDMVRGAVQAELPQVPCSWLTLTKAEQSGAGVDLGFSGVAGHPANAEAAVFKAVGTKGAKIASSDFSGVAPVDASFCVELDGIRPIRSTDTQRLSASQPKYEISTFSEGDSKGQLGARVIMDLSLEGMTDDFALYSIEESGEVSEIIPSKAVFLAGAKAGGAIEQLPGRDRYRISIDGTRSAGWSGILLLTGHGFDTALLQNIKLADWQARFAKAAQKGGWKAEMVWFKFVDEVPN